MRVRNLFVAATLVVSAGCAAHVEMDEPEVVVPSEISAQVAGLERGWLSGQPDAVRPYYSSRAVVVTSTDRYTGWEDIRTRWLAGMSDISDMQITTTGISREGNDIIETGRYSFQLRTEDGPQRVNGVFAHRWQRESDGTWRVVSATVQ